MGGGSGRDGGRHREGAAVAALGTSPAQEVFCNSNLKDSDLMFASGERGRWEGREGVELVRGELRLRGYRVWVVGEWVEDRREGGGSIVEETGRENDYCLVNVFQIKRRRGNEFLKPPHVRIE